MEGLEFKTGRKPARPAEAVFAVLTADLALLGGARLVLPVLLDDADDVAVPATLALDLAATP